MEKLSDLAIFVSVVEEGSFSAAARSLGLTPSTISRQISALEDDLGSRLFHRTTRKQSLSEAGALFFPHAKRITGDLEAARLAVRQLADHPAGRLILTAEAALATQLIAPLLPRFLDRYPEIELELSTSAALLDLVEGRIDLAIRMGHLEDSSLIARRLAQSHSQLYAAPSYLATRGWPKHPEDLLRHSCLSFRLGAAKPRWRFRMGGDVVELAIEAPIKASSLMFLRSLAEAGRGIIMIPAWMVQDSLRRGALVPVLTEATLEPPTTPINAVFAHHRQLAPKVRVLVDFLAAEMQALCPLPGSHSTLGQSSVTRVAVGSSSNPNHASTKS